MAKTHPPGFSSALSFPLFAALTGRRSRRFPVGASIPDGPLAYASDNPPLPLSELETMLVVTSMSGNTGWHDLIYRNALYAPKLSNYALAAGGRTFPSAAGFHTSTLFYTDDSGTFLLDTRDAPALAERDGEGLLPPEELLAAHRGRVRRVLDTRLDITHDVPHVEGHNTWVVNAPGTLLAFPVADLARHLVANLCYYLQNGAVLTDDLNGRAIPGIDAYADLADTANPLPLSFVELWTFGEATAEMAASCYAGALMLQAMGLGGWMFNGVNPFSILGASGDPAAPGLGFDHHADPAWPWPHVTGRKGVLEALTPPNVPDMRAAVEAVCEAKFGPGGPFHPDTPGPFRDTRAVRSAAAPHDPRFRDCVALQAQYILDTFGKFPATVPALYVQTYLQACHLELGFYDRHFAPGAYLRTHAGHMAAWHPNDAEEEPS